MITASDPVHLKEFFDLGTVGSLRLFRSTLDASVPEQAALAYYISTWPFYEASDDSMLFTPRESLSPDRTAIMYGAAPVIFEGTNRWCTKPYLSLDELRSKLAGLEILVSSIRRLNPNTNITLVLIPEKDHVISRFILGEDRFERIEKCVNILGERLAALGVKLIFDQPFWHVRKEMEINDFCYGDSHLASLNYLKIFESILESFGAGDFATHHGIELTERPVFGDLAKKFDGERSEREIASQPYAPSSRVTQVAGSESFSSPLGETWQEFTNSSPIIDESICILGDSHCSIYEQRRLTYMLSNIYGKTRFSWNPCGIREKIGALDFDNVLLETSSRFVV